MCVAFICMHRSVIDASDAVTEHAIISGVIAGMTNINPASKARFLSRFARLLTL